MSISPGEKQAALLLTLTMLCYAGNHVIGRAVHGELPPLGLSFWRWIFGAAILLPFVAPGLGRAMSYYRRHWPLFALLGLTMIGSTSLVLVGLNFTTATNTSLINATQPTITALLCWIFLRDRLSLWQWCGIVIAFVGIAQMILRADWQVLSSLSFNRGDLIVLLAMFGFATYAINIRRIPGELTPAQSLFGVIVFGLVPLLPFYLVESVVYRTVSVTWHTLLVVITLSLLVSVLGMLMWTRGNQLIGPNRAAVYMNLLPLFGVILAVVFLRENVAAHHLVGGVLIGGGDVAGITQIHVEPSA
jgi:drug/metabolite transporter (DMT)-like permease